MRLLATVLLLISAVLSICVPYFVGHGLALKSSGWVIAGLCCGVLAAGAITLTIRVWPAGRPGGAEHG